MRSRASGPWALTGVHVWTGDGGPLAGAIAFGADGRIAACGSHAEALAALPAGAERVDGRGAFVCPGFVDPHVHVRASASARLAGDASEAVHGPELLDAVRHTARGRGGWISLVGARITSPLHGDSPSRLELDRAGRGAPVRIRDRGGHGWLLSSAALRRVGVNLQTAGTAELAPAGVLIERDGTGVATGFVTDHVGWVGDRLGRLASEGALVRAVAGWSHELARLGVVAICDATATNDKPRIESLERWRASGALRQELTYLASPATAPDCSAATRCAGIKFAAAGDRRLAPTLRRMAGSGRQIAVHCIDPSETGAVLTAAAAIPPVERAPLRLEHAAFVPPDWIPEIARLGATVVTHPAFIAALGDRYLEDPELEPHDWLYRLRSWAAAGVPLAFASDAPFGPADPVRALRAAASRRTAAGRSIGPGEALSGEPALRALTTVPARLAGLDRYGYGRIAPGGPGAVVVLSEDPRDPATLDRLELVATVIDGDAVD
jgi:predicted amidohydrolase YtcJ